MSASIATALERRLVLCRVCGLLCRRPVGPERSALLQCPRCRAAVRCRQPRSLERTIALLSSAAILYVPANLLPIMHTTTAVYDGDDTILSGIVALWSGASWPLALLVFFVSIMVPMLKFIALTLLVVATHRGSSWRLHERASLYRFVEFIGRWSMLDVFVVSLLVALVQLRAVATISAGPGVVAFASVVVLTMYATQSFDPRLMWDRARR